VVLLSSSPTRATPAGIDIGNSSEKTPVDIKTVAGALLFSSSKMYSHANLIVLKGELILVPDKLSSEPSLETKYIFSVTPNLFQIRSVSSTCNRLPLLPIFKLTFSESKVCKSPLNARTLLGVP